METTKELRAKQLESMNRYFARQQYSQFTKESRYLMQEKEIKEGELNCILVLGQGNYIANDEQLRDCTQEGKLVTVNPRMGVKGIEFRVLVSSMQPFLSQFDSPNMVHSSTVSQITDKLAEKKYLLKGLIPPKYSPRHIGLLLTPTGVEIYHKLDNLFLKYFVHERKII